jgi:hypothetical protein
MRVAVLLGFCYKDLIGSVIDLYRMYNFCKDKAFSEIRIITDISPTLDMSSFASALIESEVSTDMEGFLQDAKAEVVQCKSQLLHSLERAGNEFVLLYVSGHGRIGHGLICPDQLIATPQELRQALSARHQVEVWDVCGASSFIDLPYVWNRTLYDLSNTQHYATKILAFVSSRQLDDETAISSNHGSLSTRTLLTVWEKTCILRDYAVLYRKEFTSYRYEHRHYISIYASVPSIYLLPSWVYSTTFVDIFWTPIVHWRVYRLDKS